MSHKIPLVVAAALAALLVLTVVQAGEPTLVNVDTTIEAATEDSAKGTITVCNVSADSPMTIETVAVNLYYKQGQGPGAWMDLAEVSDLGAGNVIPGECNDYSWVATYALPDDGASRIRIEAQVTVEERPDKVFISRDCVDFPYP